MAKLIEKAHEQAWVTLATTDSYALGALVLGSSLRRAGTTRKKVVLVTSGTMSKGMLEVLRQVYDEVVDVSVIDSKDAANLALLERPELGITFTKLHCWRLTRFQKAVFLDADTLVLRNCDELFDREEFSAAPDAGWPDCFNSGVFVFKPSEDTYDALVKHISSQGSFDGGDQGLLNTFFSDWATKDIAKHLSFLYNMCATATYTYLPAYRFYGHNVRIIHFIGASKPWHVEFDPSGVPQPRYGEEHTVDHLKKWWQIFHTDVKPMLGQGLESVVVPSGAFPSSSSHPQQQQGPSGAAGGQGGAAAAAGPQDKRERWEEGHPDYMGSASFDNILKKIETTMSSPDQSPLGSQNDLSSSLPNLDQLGTYWPPPEQQQHEQDRPSSAQENPHFTPFTADPPPPPPDPAVVNRAEWEKGRPDYLGVNAFDNIMAKLEETMSRDWEEGGGRGEWGHHWQHQEGGQQHNHHHDEHWWQNNNQQHDAPAHSSTDNANHHQSFQHAQQHEQSNENNWHDHHHQESHHHHDEHHHHEEKDSSWSSTAPPPPPPQPMDQSPDPATDADNEASSDEEHQEQQGQQQQQQQEGAAFLGKQEEGEEKRAAAEEEQVPPPPPPLPLDYREDWERNQPDFRGKASFDLILRRIEASTGKLRKPGEVTPSTIVEPKKEEDPATTTDSQKKENVKDAATQTPTLSSPYDPGLRQLKPVCPSCGQMVSLEERKAAAAAEPTTPTSSIEPPPASLPGKFQKYFSYNNRVL